MVQSSPAFRSGPRLPAFCGPRRSTVVWQHHSTGQSWAFRGKLGCRSERSSLGLKLCKNFRAIHQLFEHKIPGSGIACVRAGMSLQQTQSTASGGYLGSAICAMWSASACACFMLSIAWKCRNSV
eukprot:3847796-Rhodomonas_salina.10